MFYNKVIIRKSTYCFFRFWKYTYITSHGIGYRCMCILWSIGRCSPSTRLATVLRTPVPSNTLNIVYRLIHSQKSILHNETKHSEKIKILFCILAFLSCLFSFWFYYFVKSNNCCTNWMNEVFLFYENQTYFHNYEF